MKLLGIIPARGGSKGIPQKNMQLLNNKPLVLHALDTAMACGCLDRIIVSSDDETILNCVREQGETKIAFKRPAYLAEDTTLISAVIAHLLNWLQIHENYKPDAFMLLEPTCPLRTKEDIREAVKQFAQSSNPCLLSVSPVQQHPSNMIFSQNGHWQYCLPRKETALGRQDFAEAWFINGGVYLTQCDFFQQTKKIYDLQCCDTYIMPYERSFDINTPFDLALVRAHDSILKSKTGEVNYV